MEEKQTFIFFRDWKTLFEMLDDDDDRVQLLYAIINYPDKEPPFDGFKSNRRMNKAWLHIKSKLDENNKKWEEAKKKRSEAGRKGGQAKPSNAKQSQAMPSNAKQSQANQAVTVTGTVTVTDNVTVNGVSNNPNGLSLTKEKENSKEKRFIKPTLEEIEQFIVDNGYSVDAETFFDFYEAKGWKIGKAPMKDFRAAIRNWHRKNVTNDKVSFAKNDFLAAYDRGELT